MTMQVVYHDNTRDMISSYTLDSLIESSKIKMFYRPSEDRWIIVGADSVRRNTQALCPYGGNERRLANVIAAQLV